MVAIELAYINTKHPDFHRDAAMAAYKVDSLAHNKPMIPALTQGSTNDTEKSHHQTKVCIILILLSNNFIFYFKSIPNISLFFLSRHLNRLQVIGSLK